MAKRPTIQDLAREAGVGVATVDRVLHGRDHVRQATAQRVAEAAERIGYHAAGLLQARAATWPKMRYGFVLQKPAQAFYRDFAARLERAVADHPEVEGRADILFPAHQTPDDYCDAIRRLADRCDGVAVVAPNQPQIAALLRDLRAEGKPVFTLLNDLAQGDRLGYFGTDNIKVGRIAAWMITTQLHSPGKLATFVGSSRWHGHILRETGFRSYVHEFAPKFQLLDTMVNLDTRQLTYEATLDLLERHPDLRGLYVAGGGMEGAIAALRDSRPAGRVALVVNEITPESRAALTDRYACLAMATPLAELCRRVVAAMTAAKLGAAPPPGQVFMDPVLYTPESV